MRDAITALVCSLFLLAALGWPLLRSPTPGGVRFFLVVAALTAAAWLAWLVFERPKVLSVERSLERQRRRAAGLCTRCAYNLSGNVSGVCPECGTARP